MKLGNAMDGKVDGWETLMVEVFKTNVWNNKLRMVLVMKQEACFQQVKSVARLFESVRIGDKVDCNRVIIYDKNEELDYLRLLWDCPRARVIIANPRVYRRTCDGNSTLERWTKGGHRWRDSTTINPILLRGVHFFGGYRKSSIINFI